MAIRRGDQVVVIAGKDKGKKGKVTEVNENRVTVDGVNIVIKHKKAKNAQTKSAREKKTASIDVSNVMVLCTKCGKATRISHKIENGKKYRVCGKCGEILDKKFVKVKEKAKEAEEVKDKDDKKEDQPIEKKPLVRREVKNTAESKIKRPQNMNKSNMGHRQLGGGE